MKALLCGEDWTEPRLFTVTESRNIGKMAWVYGRCARSMEGPRKGTRWVYVKPANT